MALYTYRFLNQIDQKKYVIRILKYLKHRHEKPDQTEMAMIYIIKPCFRDIVSLPRLTDEGFRVTIFRVKPNYPESSSDMTATVRAVLLVCEARMRDEHKIAGDVFIYEVSKVKSTCIYCTYSDTKLPRNLFNCTYPFY